MVPVTKSFPSHLPDLCLENIFSRVPLLDLLRSVRVVCTNWYRVAPTDLRRRQTVVLKYKRGLEQIRWHENAFRSDLIEHVRNEDGSRLRSIDQIGFDALLGGRLTEAFTTPLMDTLPGITHLTVEQNPNSQYSTSLLELVRLLNFYRNRLVSLKLVISFRRNNVTRQHGAHNELVTNTTSLVESINQLDSLRHLSFWLTSSVAVNFVNLPKLSILSRLDTFTSNIESVWLMDSIRVHATTGQVRIDWTQAFGLEELLRLDPQLASRFTSVIVSNTIAPTHNEQMRQFGVGFSAITRLTLDICLMPMTMLAQCLSPLTQLIYLEIRYLSITGNLVLEADFVPVPSVSLLSIKTWTSSHLDTELLHLAELFPNLQVLGYQQSSFRCQMCEYRRTIPTSNIAKIDVDRIKRCIRLSRQPFRRCARLHTIKLNDNCAAVIPRSLINRYQL